MFGSVFEAVVQAIIAVFCSAVVLLVTMSFFQSRPKQQKPDSVASFFALEELISRTNLRGLALFFSAPFALLFLVVAEESPAFVDLGREFLINDILSVVSNPIKDAIKPFLEGMPAYLSPLFILVVALILFSPYIRSPFEWFRNLVIAATGIDARADDSGSRAATEALTMKSEAEINQTLNVTVPATLSDSFSRVAYMIIYRSINDTKRKGLGTAIRNTLILLGTPRDIKIKTIRLSPSRIIAALVFYFVLALLWVLIAPLAAAPLSNIAASFAPFTWPLPDFRGDLVLSISRHTLSFIVPLAFGMYMYPARREHFAKTETPYQTFAVVFSIQFIAAVVVDFLFDVIAILLRVSGKYEGLHISLGEVKIWADVVLPALAPGFALAVWIQCQNWKVRWFIYLAVCLAGAISFCLCQLSYEWISGTMRGYYWHEFVLGAFLTLAYFFAGSITWDVVRPPDASADDRSRVANALRGQG
jgi:hypothetical protein